MSLTRFFPFMAILKRDVINIVLNPVLLVTNTLFPLLLVLALGYLTRDNYGASGISSYDFYGITILIYTILNASMTASNSFMEKSLKKGNLRTLYAPMPPSFLYLSKILATFLFTSACYLALVLLLNTWLGVHFGGGQMLFSLTILLLFNLFSCILGVFFCCLLKSEELSNKILSFINNLLALVGGLFFSLDGFGNNMATLSYLSPVKWVAEGLFRMIYDQDFSFFAPAILILSIGSFLLLLACKWTFKMEDYV